MTKKYHRNHDERRGVVEMCSTDHPSVTCTKLPEFWRANKKFSTPFTVLFADRSLAPEGSRVTITAANHKNQHPELRNNQAIVTNGMARFNDLRFVGKSGRDTKFDVFIHVEAEPARTFTYKNAIKVTVDGPRPPRLKNERQFSVCADNSPQKRKSPPAFMGMGVDVFVKRARHHDMAPMYGNFPFGFLPCSSMPNSPEPSEPANSPYNLSSYMPPSPLSVVSSCHSSDARAHSTSPPSISTLSPKMLPLRKRFSLAEAGHMARLEAEAEEDQADLNDLIDTSQLMRQVEHSKANSQQLTTSEQLINTLQADHPDLMARCLQHPSPNVTMPNNNGLDMSAVLASPESRFYFFALLNYYCSNGQNQLSTLRELPFATN